MRKSDASGKVANALDCGDLQRGNRSFIGRRTIPLEQEQKQIKIAS